MDEIRNICYYNDVTYLDGEPFKTIWRPISKEERAKIGMGSFTRKVNSYSADNRFFITDEHLIVNGELVPIKALWDTGSTICMISKSLVTKLNLKPVGTTNSITSNCTKEEERYIVDVCINNEDTFRVDASEASNFTDKDGFDFIIGLNIMSQGMNFALSVTNDMEAYISFKSPSDEIIDLTEHNKEK